MIWTNLDIDKYDLFLIDLWGTVHDGRKLYDGIIETLKEIKGNGKKIYLFSNYDKKADYAEKVVSDMGLPGNVYDGIITSGETFAHDLQHGKFANKKLFSVMDSYEIEQFGCEVVDSVDEADLVVIAGSDKDINEVPFLHLGRAKLQNKPALCLNPDICTVRGNNIVPTMGFLGKYHELIGGEVIYYGKPHKRIYEYALEVAGVTDKSKIIAVGDNVDTDIKGAKNFGIDAYLVDTGLKNPK